MRNEEIVLGLRISSCFVVTFACISQRLKVQMGSGDERKCKHNSVWALYCFNAWQVVVVVVVSLSQPKKRLVRFLVPASRCCCLSACTCMRKGGAGGDGQQPRRSDLPPRGAVVAHISLFSRPRGPPVRAGATQCRTAYSVFNYVHYHYCYQQQRHQQLISIPLFSQTELELKSHSGDGLKTPSTRPSATRIIPASQM